MSQIKTVAPTDTPKNYSAPHLVCYGAMAALTQTGGSLDIEGGVRPACTPLSKKPC